MSKSKSESAQSLGPNPSGFGLSADQLGHLRHTIRLSRQLPGDWSDMGPFDPTNEGDDAYRYQLAYMAYTLAVAQYHCVPSYKELYRDTFRRLIHKMLRHDVWAYWELTSRGSKVMNPDLQVLEEGWVDPVSSKNIMYSGHLLMMVSLYEMLYRDGYFSEPGSLTFECRPPFRGLGPQDFVYDFHSLAKVIAEQFASSHGLGCECEPNGVFVYCNQFPLLGLLNYDYLYGTDLARPLMNRFKKEWGSKSNLFDLERTDDLPVFYAVAQDEVISEGSDDNKEAASVISWGPMLHVWEPDYVEALYPDVLPRVLKKTAHGHSVWLESFHRTHLEYQASPGLDRVDPMMLGVHNHGMLALLAAELGDTQTRDELLRHADARMNPTWKDGGLFYPRCDDLDTESYVTCVMGNALLGAARIVPKNGISALFNAPWGDDQVNAPELIGIDFPSVQVLRAATVADRMLITLSTNGHEGRNTVLHVTNLRDRLPVTVMVDGAAVGTVDGSSSTSGDVEWDADSGVIHLPVMISSETHIEISLSPR
jgi:hypothetical protein